MSSASDLSAIAIFGDANETDIGYFTNCVRPVRLTQGTDFIVQGAKPDGAFGLLSGSAQVLRKLPGGGEVAIAEIGAGDVVGEIGLLREDPRMAFVRATSDVEALFIERRGFRAGCERGDAPALSVMRRVNALTAQRLRHLLSRIAARSLPGHSAKSGGLDRFSSVLATSPTFAFRDFLPLFAALQHFDAAAREALVADMTPIDLERGDIVTDEGAAAATLGLMVRGAVEGVWLDGAASHIAGLYGPGSLFGLPALLDGGPSPFTLRTRERSLALRLPAHGFHEIYEREGPGALAMLDAVAEALANDLRRADNHLVRLVGLARVHSFGERDAPLAV